MKKLRLNPLAAVIMASLALAGCNSEELASVNDTTVNNSSEQTENSGSENGSVTEGITGAASLSVGVKFPKPEASPAWIGDSTTVDVEFYETGIVGSQGDAWKVKKVYEACNPDTDGDNPAPIPDGEINCGNAHEGALKGNFATSVSLTPEASNATINLLPGKYRIEAKFYNSQSQLQETSVSYVTLTAGNHSLKLRGIEATWTADKPLALSLLNNTTQDWDPTVEGTQTAAETMGITGNIVGVHLPSALTYPGSTNSNQSFFQDLLVNAGVLNENNLRPTDYATAFQPILRVMKDGQETNLYPIYFSEQTPKFDDFGNEIGGTHFWKNSSLALLFQEYTAAGAYTGLLLGDRYIGLSESDWNTDTWSARYANLEMGLFNDKVDDGEATGPVYTINRLEDVMVWDDTQGVPIETVQVAEISSYQGGSDFWKQAFVELNGVKNTFVDGNTVQGYLIESLSSEVSEWDVNIEPAMYLSATLEKIAVAEGLKASAAEANCTELAFGGVNQASTQYRWDEENQRWVAGMVNYGYQNRVQNVLEPIRYAIEWREDDIARHLDDAILFPESEEYHLALADKRRGEIDSINTLTPEFFDSIDLNKDGTATLFEDGVFSLNGENYNNCFFNETYSWDEVNGDQYTFSVDCDNPDVSTFTSGSTWEATGKMCIQPFTLRASQLNVEYETDGDIVIE
ncbi:hypothetical protein G5S52_21700 [Grimontia sp. S25]|uniref:Uncharacterized protein n=1 Tax=Grimontia sedimenti TaxID=2711294 RepID=A0A6M1RD19_9GAMM|nr:hypothetical protein [Grimontia sedimenti]NGO00144.1 hypothetical protein [Grimontia sedimenti]